MKQTLAITISDGQIVNKKPVKALFESLPNGRYKVEVSNAKQRSILQNAWLHAILPDILIGLRGIGYNDVRTTEDAKDFIKSIFFRKKISNGIDTVEVIEGTSEQSKLDFSEKAEDIIIWASQYLGIDIAPPNEQLQMNYGYEIAVANYDKELKTVIVQ